MQQERGTLRQEESHVLLKNRIKKNKEIFKGGDIYIINTNINYGYRANNCDLNALHAYHHCFWQW